MKSTIKQRLQDKVTELSTKSFLINDNAHLLQDMTHEMFTIYSWALNNASIKQLRAWKKEFNASNKNTVSST